MLVRPKCSLWSLTKVELMKLADHVLEGSYNFMKASEGAIGLIDSCASISDWNQIEQSKCINCVQN